MVNKRKKSGRRGQMGSPSQEVPPSKRRASPRRSGSSVQDDFDDRVLPTSPQAGNKGDLGNIHVSPNDESLDYQVNTDVIPGVLASREVLADNNENDNKDRASNTPPVNDPEDKLDLSPASNSKTSMDNSAGHRNDDGKKASGTDASSSSDESSSSDDAEDGAVPAPSLNRGKNLAFQGRFGQGKQLHHHQRQSLS